MRILDRVLNPQPKKALTIGRMSDGMWIPPFGRTVSIDGRSEPIPTDFESVVTTAIHENGVAFACAQARLLPFTEARFQYQEMKGGRPGRLFDGPGLELLETPWPNATTGELLGRMEQDATCGGNGFYTTVGSGDTKRIRRMRPDLVTILSAVRGDIDRSAWALDAEVIGYIYRAPREDPVLLSVDQVVHYSPIPDPLAQWRGMSWLTPIMREIYADTAAVTHKEKFFKNGATPPFAITYDATVTPEEFEQYVELFKLNHVGADNAGKVLHLGGGAEPTTVGLDLKAIDFKNIQGSGETRIAAASGVGAVIAQLSEGLAGSALNSGNYGAAKRRFADMTLRPLWRSAAGVLSKFSEPPAGSRLWTDTRDVAFLAEDAKDEAEILAQNAQTIRALVDAGYQPDAVIDAVEAGDLSRLTGKHSGLFSVQLQPAGPLTTSEEGT